MKNIKNFLLVVLSSLILFSCSKDEVENSYNLSVEELTLELKNDIDFNEITSKNADFSLLLINKLQNSNIEIKYSTQDNVDVNQLIIDLGIVNEFNQHIQQINEHIQNVRYRYKNLNILCKENVLTIINDLPIRESYRSSANALRVHNDCNAQFQADMQAIHDQYDSAISMCTIATLLSGGLASPCYLYAVVNAIFQTSFAIDRHKFCELNNQ